MKKIFFILIIVLFLFNYKSEEIETVFLYEKEEVFDNYTMKFEECILNTNNFLEKLDYFNDKDFRILEIIPYHNLENKYLFYSNNLENIYDQFKNHYLDIMLENSMYTTNICIKEIRINTSNYILDEYKNIIDFYY